VTKNHITDRPHPAANSVRIASAAFPSTIESLTTRKLANNSSITNKEHLDRCPIPDNGQIQLVAASNVPKVRADDPPLSCNFLFVI